MFFIHFASANELPGFSTTGTLGVNRLKVLLQQIPILKFENLIRGIYFVETNPFQSIVSFWFLTYYILFKCNDKNPVQSTSPPTFYEQLFDLKSNELTLSTQQIVCYQSVAGGVGGGMRCWSRGG